MKNDPHPVELAAVTAMALGWALLTLLRTVLVPALALLLVLAGWRPAAAAPQAPRLEEPAAFAPLVLACSAEPAALPAPPLAGLRVTELRALARAAGLAQLGRCGRRADLLAALQALPA